MGYLHFRKPPYIWSPASQVWGMQIQKKINKTSPIKTSQNQLAKFMPFISHQINDPSRTTSRNKTSDSSKQQPKRIPPTIIQVQSSQPQTSSTKFNKNNSSQPSSPKKSFLTTHQFLSQEINPKIDQEIIPSTTSIQTLDGRQAGHSGANHQDLGWVHLACGRELPSTEATKVVAGLGCFTGEEGESWEQDLRGDLIRG